MNGKNPNKEELIIQELSKKIDELRKELPNGELASILDDVKIVVSTQKKLSISQQQLSEIINELRDTIMHPEHGLVVKVNKNTEYRNMLEGHESDNASILEEHQGLVKWKSTVEKALWILFTVLVGILAKLYFS